MSMGTRHVACTLCRERKIRCDGAQPSCQRCMRKGQPCVYQADNQRLEIAETLQNMNARLVQAEAALIPQDRRQLIPVSFASAAPPDSTAFLGSILDPTFPVITESFPALGDKNQDFTFASTDIQSLYMPEPSHGFDQPPGSFTVPGFHDSPIGLSDMAQGLAAEINPRVVSNLQNRYFETIHGTYPMIERQRFLANTSVNPVSPEVKFLQYAVCAHGAALTKDSGEIGNICYQHARRWLHQIQEEGLKTKLYSISVLQACILVALYEAKRLDCHRAVSSMSLVTYLIKQLWLHAIDRPLDGQPVSRCRNGLGPTSDNVEMEERRRTFWAAYSIESLTSVLYGWTAPIDVNEIQTYLPFLNPLNEATTFLQGQPFSLTDPPQLSDDVSMAGFNAVIFTTALAALCLRHVELAHGEISEGLYGYNFWSQHFRLDGGIKHISASSLSCLTQPQYSVDSNVFFARIIIRAATILLHQSAVHYAQKTQMADEFVAESPSQCLTAAFEIADAVRQAHHLNTAKMSPFTPWPIFTAAQIFVRALQCSNPLSNADLLGSQTLGAGSSTSSGAGQKNPGMMLDCLQALMASLSSMKALGGLAGACLNHLNREINGGEQVTSENIVGRVNFDPDEIQDG